MLKKNCLLVCLLMTFVLSQNAFAGKKLKDGSMMSMSKLAFNDTVSTLIGAIEDSNLMVIKVVDAQKMLRMAGKKTKGMKQIFFFHPFKISHAPKTTKNQNPKKSHNPKDRSILGAGLHLLNFE